MRADRRGLTLLELLFICLVFGTLASILIPNFIRARAQGRMSGCPNNLKNIATALEMYSTDYGGVFPVSIPGPLTPNYLRTLPTCPAAGSVTYIEGYHVTNNPDTYSIHCHGQNHRGLDIVTPCYPQYNSATGLIKRPQ